jgi:hypothetical protein
MITLRLHSEFAALTQLLRSDCEAVSPPLYRDCLYD